LLIIDSLNNQTVDYSKLAVNCVFSKSTKYGIDAECHSTIKVNFAKVFLIIVALRNGLNAFEN